MLSLFNEWQQGSPSRAAFGQKRIGSFPPEAGRCISISGPWGRDAPRRVGLTRFSTTSWRFLRGDDDSSRLTLRNPPAAGADAWRRSKVTFRTATGASPLPFDPSRIRLLGTRRPRRVDRDRDEASRLQQKYDGGRWHVRPVRKAGCACRPAFGFVCLDVHPCHQNHLATGMIMHALSTRLLHAPVPL